MSKTKTLTSRDSGYINGAYDVSEGEMTSQDTTSDPSGRRESTVTKSTTLTVSDDEKVEEKEQKEESDVTGKGTFQKKEEE